MRRVQNYITNHPKIAGLVLVIFHAVGLVGLASSEYRSLFISLTPFNLLLGAILLLTFHRNFTLRTGLVFIAIAVWGFLVEMMGVNTGWPFGEYTYQSALGVKLVNTPLLIGLNWVVLSYGFFTLAKKIKAHWVIQMLVAAIGMVVLDLFIEPLAPFMDMWIWAEGSPPFENFVAWFAVSLVCMLIYEKLLGKHQNKLAIWFVATQFVFFTLLNLIAF
ncbi:MAG: carotenoid biosynthesis protein [Bacteroidales bacterium]|nr:carotenoid biosynthesis protein [Bacteroidales bacterium]MCF8457159.1 carotenoid biosynthesis protein [Bacteroidales bacterium]